MHLHTLRSAVAVCWSSTMVWLFHEWSLAMRHAVPGCKLNTQLLLLLLLLLLCPHCFTGRPTKPGPGTP
jgi:hypothetical protein